MAETRHPDLFRDLRNYRYGPTKVLFTPRRWSLSRDVQDLLAAYTLEKNIPIAGIPDRRARGWLNTADCIVDYIATTRFAGVSRDEKVVDSALREESLRAISGRELARHSASLQES
jgi:hypothetical protein